MSKLDDINNELKDYINESAFISNKCRNKVIAMLGEEFDIKFSLDNYKTIDVTIKFNPEKALALASVEKLEITDEVAGDPYIDKITAKLLGFRVSFANQAKSSLGDANTKDYPFSHQ